MKNVCNSLKIQKKVFSYISRSSGSLQKHILTTSGGFFRFHLKDSADLPRCFFFVFQGRLSNFPRKFPPSFCRGSFIRVFLTTFIRRFVQLFLDVLFELSSEVLLVSDKSFFQHHLWVFFSDFLKTSFLTAWNILANISWKLSLKSLLLLLFLDINLLPGSVIFVQPEILISKSSLEIYSILQTKLGKNCFISGSFIWAQSEPNIKDTEANKRNINPA